MKRLLLPLILLCLTTAGKGQDSLLHVQDSLLYVIQQIITEDSIVRSEMQFNHEGVFMPLRGVIQTLTHRNFNRLPGPYPKTSIHWEDYGLALSPLAATWIMKACGIKSRSTTRRMFAANGLAVGLAVGLAQTLRWTSTEKRPDGYGSDGFPSMHASLAFMGATILSREYGHISPWITIGGYAAATGTQMLRIGRNAHWMNDIFMGAGIGVVSTHLAYYMTDRILGRKGIRRMPLSKSERAELHAWNNQPSGFRLISGTETSGRSLSAADFADFAPDFNAEGVTLRSSASLTTGFEAEWYLNHNLFLSAIGRYTMSQAKLEIPDPSVVAWGEQIHLYHGNVAAGWVMPLTKNIRIGARTLWGVRYNEAVTFHRVAPGHLTGTPLLTINSQLCPSGGAGILIDMLQSHNQTVGFSFDFLHTFGTRFLHNRWVIGSSWKAMF